MPVNTEHQHSLYKLQYSFGLTIFCPRGRVLPAPWVDEYPGSGCILFDSPSEEQCRIREVCD